VSHQQPQAIASILVGIIRAAYYSGTIVAAGQNDFFATDENLIELRREQRPT
jgi:hypothetical protein